MTETKTLQRPGVDLVYDVRGPLPPADGAPPAAHDRPADDGGGLRSARRALHGPHGRHLRPARPGPQRPHRRRHDHTPQQQAADLHLLIEALGAGPVDVFASSGGAVTALELVATHPGDVVTLVAHEPPINAVLPDAAAAERARAGFHEAYQAKGTGAGMAAFIAMTSWQGEFTDAYFAQPDPDPAMFGMPTDDDGTPRRSAAVEGSWAITDYRPDASALTAAPTRIVVAVGEESADTYTARTAVHAAAARPGGRGVPEPPRRLPGAEFGYAGKPEEFAARLREVLDG